MYTTDCGNESTRSRKAQSLFYSHNCVSTGSSTFANGYGIRRTEWFGKPRRIPVSCICFPLHFYGRILSFDSNGHRRDRQNLFSSFTWTQCRSGSHSYLGRLGTRTSHRIDNLDHVKTYSPLRYTLGISSSQCTDVGIRNNRHGLPSPILLNCSALLRLLPIYKFPVNCC